MYSQDKRIRMYGSEKRPDRIWSDRRYGVEKWANMSCFDRQKHIELNIGQSV